NTSHWNREQGDHIDSRSHPAGQPGHCFDLFGGVEIQAVFGQVGHGANQDDTARGEIPVGLAECLKPISEDFFQFP
ncbi:MAG: hypothetical protein ACK55I_39915, partial [bacterium]